MAVYKKITLVGTSPAGVNEAIQAAVERAAETLRHLCWFEVKEIRGSIENGKVKEYQVILEVAFRLEGEQGAA